MENEIIDKFREQDEKLNAIFRSVEKTRKYFMWTLIISLILFVLPLVGLLIYLPSFLQTYANSLGI